MIKRFAIIMILCIAIVFIVCSTAKNEQPVKTWKIPDYMVENLNYMINDFNQRFEARVSKFKAELRENFKGFADMPDDVVMDLKSGVFIDRADYVRLLQEAQAKQAEKQKAQGEQKK